MFMPPAGAYVDYAAPFLRGTEALGGDEFNILRFALPTNRAVGDYAIAVVHTEVPAANTITTPTGWTALITNTNVVSSNRQYRVYGRQLDGSELDTIDVTHDGSTRRYATCTHVIGGSRNRVGASNAEGTSGLPNPPSISPPSPAPDRNMLAWVSGMYGANRDHTSYPNDLNQGRREEDAAGNTDSQTAIAGRRYFGQGYNPNSFGITGSTGSWSASTVGIW